MRVPESVSARPYAVSLPDPEKAPVLPSQRAAGRAWGIGAEGEDRAGVCNGTTVQGPGGWSHPELLGRAGHSPSAQCRRSWWPGVPMACLPSRDFSRVHGAGPLLRVETSTPRLPSNFRTFWGHVVVRGRHPIGFLDVSCMCDSPSNQLGFMKPTVGLA